jgi:hypothetical protein
MANKTREQWIHEAADEIDNTILIPAAKELGFTFYTDKKKDKSIRRYTMSWPSRGAANNAKRRVVGQCCHPEMSQGNVWEILLTLGEADVPKILTTLLHEMIHVVAGHEDRNAGHGQRFKSLALASGLDTPMRSTPATKELLKQFKKMARKLGKLHHDAVNYTTTRKKQGVRNLKFGCTNCQFTGRAALGSAKKTADVMGVEGYVLPKCDCNGKSMEWLDENNNPIQI